MINDWNLQQYTEGINTVDVDIIDPCAVDIALEYFDNTGQARVSLSWTKL